MPIVPTIILSPAEKALNQLRPVIKKWANQQLLDFYFSGSYAKCTAIKGATDIDLFISLRSNTGGAMEEIYNGLYSYLIKENKYVPRRQNVSIGITFSGLSIDLIPAKKQSGNTDDHTLFRFKKRTWTQTNVKRHISLIRNSGRIDEIITLKIWRKLNQLEFPSFYLELTTLEALRHQRSNQLASNIQATLEYLKDKFLVARVVDPSNTNNIISDDISDSEKSAIANAATTSLKKPLNRLIW